MMVPDHPVEVIGGFIIVNGQGDSHKDAPPQFIINNVKDPLQVCKVSISNTAWVVNVLRVPDQSGV